MKLETWATVAGYESLYEVSNLGNVRSFQTSRKRPIPGHVLKPKKSGAGYHAVGLYKDRKCTTKSVHSLVAAAFLGPTPPGMNINHKDGNKKNNSLDNLEHTTFSENTRHAFSNGLMNTVAPKGEKNGNAVISEAQALEVISRLANNERPCNIARDMCISKWPVYGLKVRRTWVHLFAAVDQPV